MYSAFHGTIYEPFDFFAAGTHDIVVHTNPSVSDSAVLMGERPPKERMLALAEAASEIFRQCIPDEISFQRIQVEGFLIFALGMTFQDDVSVKQEELFAGQLLSWLENALKIIHQQLELSLQLSVSAIHLNTQNVYDAYQEAFSIALHFPFLQHSGQIILYREFQNGLSALAIEEKALLEKQFYGLMQAENYEDAEKTLLRIVELRASTPATVTSLTQELISRMNFFAYQLCDSLELPLGIQDNLIRKIQRIHSVKTMRELRLEIHAIFSAMQQVKNSGTHQGNSGWPRKISLYIQNNYADPDLNAEKISRQFGFNPAYISHLFHGGTGMKLLDYIHTTRIEHVKDLLRCTNMSLNDIAVRTGYIDRYSMSRVFKRYVGITPSDYRRQG